MATTSTTDQRATDPRVERSRAKLLAAATDLIVEAGPQALTVDAVAERSGVAKSTLYRHWPSREALMIDVLRSHVPDIPEPDPGLGFEAQLRGLVRALAEAFTDPEWARIVPALFALKHHVPGVEELTEADRDEQVALLRRALDTGAAEGVVPPGLDPDVVAVTLVGPMLMCVLTGDTELVPTVADYTVERFLASYRDR